MKRVFVGPLLHLVYRPWVRGAENVPEEGAAILASNHLAVIDSFFLPLVLDRELVFIGKQEYFTGAGIKGRLTRGSCAASAPSPWTAGAARPARPRCAPVCAAWRTGTSSASTRRAPAAPTVGSTAARRASRGWRWSPAPR